MPPPMNPMRPGVSGMQPIPDDEYGDGHKWVNPKFSRNTNRQAVYGNTTDGNVGAYEDLYGSPGNEPTPYGGAKNGLSPAEQGVDRVANIRYADLFRRGSELLGGDDAFAELMDEVLRIAASQEASGQQVTGNLDTTQLPPPDFGAMQPVTDREPTDANMADLEGYYGYPVKARQPGTPPWAPTRNGPRNALAGIK